MKSILSYLIVLLALCACYSDDKVLSELAFDFNIDYIHSGEGGQGKGLNDFVTQSLKGRNWTTYENIKISLKDSKETLEFKKDQYNLAPVKVLFSEKGKNHRFELDSLSKEGMQELINLRFSDVGRLLEDLKKF